jgi:hypothetical protein
MSLISVPILIYAILIYRTAGIHVARFPLGGFFMATNLINVNPQMQKFAENAVIVARDKFGVNLDFTENSLQNLETLLQQAYDGYKQSAVSVNASNVSIENTVRVWGSYFGEVIRHQLGGDWIVDQKDVLLQLGSRRLDPLGQVRSRIVDGQLYNVQSFFSGITLRNPE